MKITSAFARRTSGACSATGRSSPRPTASSGLSPNRGTRKVEFYDRRGDLLKTLKLREYREYEGGYWRPHRFEMVNHQTGKQTALVSRLPIRPKAGCSDGLRLREQG